MTQDHHLTAIAQGRITRTNLIGMRKAMNACARYARGYSISPTAPLAATDGRAQEYEQRVIDHPPLVTGALHDSGVKLLRSNRWRKRFNAEQAAIIASPSLQFHLVRFDWIDALHCQPVYRATDGATGDSFNFRNIPWQTAHYMELPSGPTIEME